LRAVKWSGCQAKEFKKPGSRDPAWAVGAPGLGMASKAAECAGSILTLASVVLGLRATCRSPFCRESVRSPHAGPAQRIPDLSQHRVRRGSLVAGQILGQVVRSAGVLVVMFETSFASWSNSPCRAFRPPAASIQIRPVSMVLRALPTGRGRAVLHEFGNDLVRLGFQLSAVTPGWPAIRKRKWKRVPVIRCYK